MTDKPASPPPAQDFDVAKTIFESLKDLGQSRQQRVLRWVSELLDLPNTVAQPAPRHIVTQHPTEADLSAPNTRVTIPATPPSEGPTDIRSFVAQKAPKSDIEFVTVAAHYYRFVAPADQRLDTIDQETVRNATREADWDRLVNPLQTLNNAVRKGYLGRAAAGAFRINTVGENLVARALPASSSTRGEGSPRKKATAGAKNGKRKNSAKATRAKK